MLRRVWFLLTFALSVFGLHFWARGVQSSLVNTGTNNGAKDSKSGALVQADLQAGQNPDPSQRRALLEALDRLVAYEHYYRSVYGRFTKMKGRLGFHVPEAVQNLYEIRVLEATRDRLKIAAFSEVDGQVQDFVSVDERYHFEASFPLPGPRPEFLRVSASKHLRTLKNADPDKLPPEQGLFSGYFKYEIHKDSLDRKVAIATGVKAPVEGMRLELGAEGAIPEMEDLAASESGTGQKAMPNVMSTLEEAYLAQRIFHGEKGRYARDWAELSKIATFTFEDKDQYGEGGQVPFGDAASVTEIDASTIADMSNRDFGRRPSAEDAAVEPLEIEPIFPDPKKD